MTPPNNALIPQQIYEYMQFLVQRTENLVKRNKWTDERIRRDFANRSVEQIIEDGDTSFLNPCSDVSAVSYKLITEDNKFSPTLVLEYQMNGYEIPSIHFGIELNDQEDTYTLDYMSGNVVLAYKGSYSNQQPGIKTLDILRYTAPLDSSKNLASNLEGTIKPFSRKPIVTHIINQNTEDNYKQYLKETAHLKEFTVNPPRELYPDNFR